MSSHPSILLVDDNPHDVVLIRLAFRKAGIVDTIKIVRDGREAMNYLEGKGPYTDRTLFPAPTLMLLDLQMPVISGFDLLRWVRGQSALQSLRVVVMTGSKETGDIERARSLGADSYVVKPSRFSDLVSVMKALKESCKLPDFRFEMSGREQASSFEPAV
jgi:CheY-like chemotaxis protein